MATSKRPASLLIRLDPRQRGGLQRQIYASVQRAILDGVVGPGTRLPSSAPSPTISGCPGPPRYSPCSSSRPRGISPAAGAPAFSWPTSCPTISCAGGRRGRPPASGTRRCRGAGPCWWRRPRGARRLPGPPRAFRIGTPGVDLFPVALWWRLASRRLRAITPTQLDYGEPAGLRALREAIADHVQTARGTRFSADQVLIVAGAQQGLELISRVLLDPGDRVWMEEPGYPGARSALLGAGARIVPVPVDAEGLAVETGARGAGDARLAYVTPSHQYPLGVPMSLPRRLALLRWASRAGAWVIEDDYDSQFRYGARPVPCLHGLDVDGRVIYVGSFSKTLFPALRLGFLVVPPDLQDGLQAARAAADSTRRCSTKRCSPISSARGTSPVTCGACGWFTASGSTRSPRR